MDEIRCLQQCVRTVNAEELARHATLLREGQPGRKGTRGTRCLYYLADLSGTVIQRGVLVNANHRSVSEITMKRAMDHVTCPQLSFT